MNIALPTKNEGKGNKRTTVRPIHCKKEVTKGGTTSEKEKSMGIRRVASSAQLLSLMTRGGIKFLKSTPGTEAY